MASNSVGMTALTTADLIRHARLDAAPIPPAARVAAARAIARAMSPAERAEVAKRNLARLDATAHAINASAIAMGDKPPLVEQRAARGSVVPRKCPRCGARPPEARASTETALIDWHGDHANHVHGGHR